MQIKVRLLNFKMLISAVLGALVFFLTFQLTALPNTHFQNLLFDYFSIFGYIVSILLFFISFLLLLERFILLIQRWVLYKWGICVKSNVYSVYCNSMFNNSYYLSCKIWDGKNYKILDSDLDKSGYLKKSPPDIVNIYISKWNSTNYFIDLPITI